MVNKRQVGLFALATVVVTALFVWWRLSKFPPGNVWKAAQIASVRSNAPLKVRVKRPTAGPRGASISGIVVTSTRAPVPDARVCATCASCEPTETDLHVCESTGDDGRFTLRNLPEIGLKVTAVSNRFAPGVANGGAAVLPSRAADAPGLEIVLDREGVELSGRVIDALGGPIPGASVRLIEWAATPLVAATITDDQGHFTLWAAPGGNTLVATAPHYGHAKLWRVAPSRDIELVLVPASTASGIVFTVEGQQPVAGIEVRAHRVGFAPAPVQPRATTGEDGSFTVEGLEPGEYVFTAAGQGYRGESRDRITVAVSDALEGILIGVTRAAQVSGRVVVGATGQPCLEGMAMIGVEMSGGRPAMPPPGLGPAEPRLFSEIGQGGAVRFDAVPSGQYRVAVRCAGHKVRSGPTTLDVGPEDIQGLEWVVDRGLGLAVEVVDQKEEPVPHFKVAVIRGETGLERDGQLLTFDTDASGRFTTDTSLEPGRYTIRPYLGAETEPVQVELRDGMDIVEVKLRVAGSSAIRVHVTTSDGRPVDGLEVEAIPLTSAPGAANEMAQPMEPPPLLAAAPSEGVGPQGPVAAAARGDGRYDIRPLEAGRYRVQVRDGANPTIEAEKKGAEYIDVTSGETVELNIALPPQASITGRVVDSSGAPVADIWVNAEPNRSNIDSIEDRMRAERQAYARRMTNSGRVLTDLEGRFQLDRLAEGATFDVRAEGYDGRSAVRPAVRTGMSVELTLEALSTLRGRVTDARGVPLHEFTIRATETKTNTARSARVASPEGEFVLDGVVPGKIQLSVSTRDGQRGEQYVDAAPGRTVDGLVVALQPAPTKPASLSRIPPPRAE